MKTSLAQALENKENQNGASTISLSSSYQVPATDGRMVLASPLKFCLKYRPPTIAVVYTLDKKNKKSGKPRKYIHEIRVDFDSCNPNSKPLLAQGSEKPTKGQVEALCRTLCEAEATYLNINIISKTQVLSLITKLYESKYGCKPAATPKASGDGAAPSNLFSAKPKDDDGISDDYEDDFDDTPAAKKNAAAPKPEAKGKVGAVEDDWDLENDWGELSDQKDPKKGGKAGSKGDDPDQKRQNLFFGGDKDQVTDLDDLPEVGSNFIKNDKFNQVMSSSKEGGGLLASIGLKKDDVNKDESIGDESQEEDPHKKSNLFDTSKDKIGRDAGKNTAKQQQSDEEDFDLGFGSSKKGKEAGVPEQNKSGAGDFQDMTEEEEIAESHKAINQQFQMIYSEDPELRKALERSDVASFSVEEKFQIIEAYMQGGAGYLQIEMEDDDEVDEEALKDMSEEEVQALEAQFAKLYAADPDLQSALGSIQNLSLIQKYQVLVQYQRAGETSGMASNENYLSGDEATEIIEHEGKKFRRVQIEGQDGDHLMDEEANIYTLDFEKIGKAGESDDEDDEI